MPTAQALRACPDLIVVPPDIKYYSNISRQVFEVVERFAPVVEQVSIDEAYLDLTGMTSLLGPPEAAARRLRADIRGATGLGCSVGIAANRLVAKVATDACKPDGQLRVPEGGEPGFLARFGVRALPGIGPATERWLAGRGVRTVAELQAFSAETLARHLGEYGRYLHDIAWGRGSTKFHEPPKSRSISREMTFDRDVSQVEALRARLWEMSADVAATLRSEGLYARTVRLKVRYPPFETLSRSQALAAPVRSGDELYAAALALFERTWDRGRPVRLLGVGAVPGQGTRQFDLFGEPPARAEKKERLDALKDSVRKRFGDRALVTGRDLAPREDR